jgi:hypothetical protein
MMRQAMRQHATVASCSFENVSALLNARKEPRRPIVTSSVHKPEPRTWNVRAWSVNPLYTRGAGADTITRQLRLLET